MYVGLLDPEHPEFGFTGYGRFNPTQYLQVLAAMEEWIDTGEKPDESYYFAPDYGFIPGYVPPPWPFLP